MLRRDYILRAIEECIQALMQIRLLRQNARLEEAQEAVDAECEKLAAGDAQELAKLSEMELMARLVQGQPTQTVRTRLFVMISLLQEAAEIAAAQGRAADARIIFLKALRLLLEVAAQDDPDGPPGFAPKVEALVLSLADAPMPPATGVLLMRHYESTGQLAKAEDILFSLLDNTADYGAIIDLGLAFYSRILRESDATLAAAQLPRAEAQEGQRELQRRKAL